MIWTYWEGNRPEYIQVCLDSMKRVCGNDLVIVTPENLEEYVPRTLHPSWRRLPQPALRADCIRAALLANHGGWWLDADTIVLRHPYGVNERYRDDCLYMTWTKPPRRILNGYIYMAPGYDGARRWLSLINLDLPRGGAEWCSLGEKLLTEDLTNDPEAKEIPRRLFLPIDIDSEVHHFFEDQEWGWWVHEDTVCFGLNHSYFMYHYPEAMTAPAADRTDSPLMIHRLIEYSRGAA
ncbi:capsular polysaccharide synthesis protein [Petrachloros mirabilis]